MSALNPTVAAEVRSVHGPFCPYSTRGCGSETLVGVTEAGGGQKPSMTTSGFQKLVGTTVTQAEDGRAVVTLDAGEDHANRHGTVHGGALATLVDSAMGAAVFSQFDGEQAPVTIEMKVTYLEPAPIGRLTATAQVRRAGKRITIVETEVAGENGDMVAHGIGTFTTV